MERPAAEESLIPERNLWIYDGEVRIVWKLSAYVGVFLFFSFLLLLVSLLLHQSTTLVYSIALTLAAFAATVFCMLLIEKRSVVDIGLWFRAPAHRAFWIGNGLAAGMILLVFAAELSTGLARTMLLCLEIDKALHIVAFGFVQFGFVAVGEEVLTRGYPFYALQRRFNDLTAIILTSLVFSIMHATNPSVSIFALVNIFLAGVWLGVARVLSGGLWLPIGMHLSWNLVMGSILGFPVSGIVGEGVMKTEAFGPSWITGAYFGPEGGVLVTGILLAGTVALLHPALRGRYAFAQSMETEQRSPEESS
ncbi:MAG: CPBP family intramembrane metalloprotease [Bacteroidia bacterium]|nr:CPBP family intramembrane metalloprotease [Bacteroidia bacterium]